MFPVPAGSGPGNTIVAWPDALVPARNDCCRRGAVEAVGLRVADAVDRHAQGGLIARSRRGRVGQQRPAGEREALRRLRRLAAAEHLADRRALVGGDDVAVDLHRGPLIAVGQ